MTQIFPAPLSWSVAAMELGIFGAPSFVVGRELWGNDRLEDAMAWATSP